MEFLVSGISKLTGQIYLWFIGYESEAMIVRYDQIWKWDPSLEWKKNNNSPNFGLHKKSIHLWTMSSSTTGIRCEWKYELKKAFDWLIGGNLPKVWKLWNFQPRLNDQQSQRIRWSLLLQDCSGWSGTVSLTNSIISAALPMQPTINWVFSSLKFSFPLGSSSRSCGNGITARPATKMKSISWWYASNHVSSLSLKTIRSMVALPLNRVDIMMLVTFSLGDQLGHMIWSYHMVMLYDSYVAWLSWN